MSQDFLDYKNMMAAAANGDSPRRCFGLRKAQPVGREPQIPDRLAEHAHGRGATAKRHARANRIMRKKLYVGYDAPDFAANDALYGGVACALGFACIAAVSALMLLAPHWGRSAAFPRALDRGGWCSGFDGPSCKQQKSQSDDGSHGVPSR